VLKGIKENESRALSLGYDVSRYKLLAFVISAALSGLAGSLKTLVLGFATLSDVHWSASGQVILMTLVGGLGTLSGPLFGSAVVVVLENKIGEFGHMLARITHIDWFNTLGESVTMVTGLIFVVCVLAFRRGIMGEVLSFVERLRGRANSHRLNPSDPIANGR
jgi:branched-chain amino acid transport system permease protein